MNIVDIIQTFLLEFWHEGFRGLTLQQIVLSFVIIAFFGFTRRFIADFFVWFATLFVKSKEEWDEIITKALRPPMRSLPIVIGIMLALDVLDFSGVVDRFFELFTESWLVIIVFWTFYRLVQPLGRIMYRVRKVLTTVMIDWILKILQILLVILGAASILQIWGIQIAPLIAGLGLLSLGIGLGAQDLFKNLISGLLIITEKRFHPGDWICVDGVVEGTVEKIGFRSTMVRRFDKAPVHVPNTKLSDNAVTNFSKMTHRRILWMINIEYETTKDQLAEIRDNIEQYMIDNEDYASPPAAVRFVRIDRFSDSSIDIMLYCFTKTTNWGEWLKIKEDLAYKVKAIVEKAGSGFAYPTNTLHIKSPEYDGVELFTPPEDKKAKSQKGKSKR